MKIAFVSQWYDPESGSAAIPGAMSRSLASLGNEMIAITGFPNYPTGKIYPGYRIRVSATETLSGVKVRRIPLFPSHDRSALRRVANFVSFALTSATLGAFYARKADVALIYSTPATVGLAGIVLRRVFRVPFVLYIQDLWPDTVIATGMLPKSLARPANWVLTRFCDATYRSAARIAVISPGMKDTLRSRGVPESAIDIVYNWVDERHFHPVPDDLPIDTFDVMYAGNLGDVQGLDVAVRALTRLPQHIRLILVGSGVAEDSLRQLAQEQGVSDRVIFEGMIPVEQVARRMSKAHVQLVTLRDDPLFRITMPSKIQAILACGRPLITSAPGDVRQLCEDSRAGIAVPPGEPEALAEAIRRMADMTDAARTQLGHNGRGFYEKHLSAAVGASNLNRSLRGATTS